MQVDPDDASLSEAEAEVADVQHALGRVDDGTYGTCEACGRPIDVERLADQPAARTCAEHAAG
jgi:DnaK suppressor protein